MDNAPVALSNLPLKPHASFTSRASADDIPDDGELAVGAKNIRIHSGEVAQQLLSELKGRVWVPVVRYLRPSNDGAALKATWNVK